MKGLKSILEKHHAILAGGTALAFQLGHRVSLDLDFFATRDFRTESLISEIKKSGLPFQVISGEEGTLIAEVEGIMVSFFKYDYEFLESPLICEGIRIARILDIASMKVIAVSQRGTKRDFVDLYVILRDTPFFKIADHMAKRFGRERINPIHIGKSLVYFSDADSNPEPAYLEKKEIHWESVKKFFRSHVKQFVLDLEASLKDSSN